MVGFPRHGHYVTRSENMEQYAISTVGPSVTKVTKLGFRNRNVVTRGTRWVGHSYVFEV